MKITLKEFQDVVNIIANQVVTYDNFDYDYHPERLEFLSRYFCVKLYGNYEFKTAYDFDVDMFDMGFYEETEKEIEKYFEENGKDIMFSEEFMHLRQAAEDKIEFLKEQAYKKSNYSLTDVYLAKFLARIESWFDKNGIDKAIDVLAQAGVELSEKDGANNGNKNIRTTKRKAKQSVEK